MSVSTRRAGQPADAPAPVLAPRETPHAAINQLPWTAVVEPMARRIPCLPALPLLALTLLGCGEGKEATASPRPDSGASGSSAIDLADVHFRYDPPPDAAFDPDAACARGKVPAQPVPLDMYVILDRSQSMKEPLAWIPDCKVGSPEQARWCFAINALAGFFQAPTSNGMGVALGFFPHGDCTWLEYPTTQNCCAGGTCCEGTEDAVPDVTLATLPQGAPSLVAALDTQQALGTTTPIEAALRGLVTYTAAARTPGRSMVGILVTDGAPNGCSTDTAELGAIVSQHLADSGIPTFFVGMTGSDYASLEQLGASGGAAAHTTFCAGGISPCHFYDVGNGEPAAFVDALQQIQRSVAGCDYVVPPSESGLADYSKLVLEYRSSEHATPVTLEQVSQEADCTSKLGYYVDESLTPPLIRLCPATCSTAQAEYSVTVDVLVGCSGS
jgi:hypothetical protein